MTRRIPTSGRHSRDRVAHRDIGILLARPAGLSGVAPVPASAADVDRLVYRSDLLAIGAWRCPPRHPLFRDSGPIRNHCFTFPRTAALIEAAGARPFLADPTVVELYNAGQEYRRRAVSHEGAQCDYFAIAPELLEEAFCLTHVAASRHLYSSQRRVFRAVKAGEWVEPLQIEEAVLSLLDEVVAAAARSGGRTPSRTSPSEGRRADLAEDARGALAVDLADPLPLGVLARRLACSPFHLCRVFRARTGYTLHRYRTELRLRTALERLEQGDEITRVALDLGFSSHSHFTAAFKAAFGSTPRHFRQRRGTRPIA